MRKKICPYCGKLHPEGTECSRKKEIYNKKKKEYNSTYEESKELRTTKWYRFRKKIINRDHGRCQRCLIKYGILTVRPLEVHHIKSRIHYPELMYDENNTITMCKTCNLQLGIQDKLDFEWSPPEKEGYNL